MAVAAAYLVPHPPLIFPEVGRGKQLEIRETTDAYLAVSEEVAALRPDTVVVVSPHAVMYADYFHISPGRSAAGDMKQFGASGLRIGADYDEEFAERLASLSDDRGFPAGVLGEKDGRLDHGTSIPVRFLKTAFEKAGIWGVRFVRAGVSGLSVEDHYRFGLLIRETAAVLDRKTVFIASGDLSHKLSDSGPYGYAPEGPAFDKLVMKTVRTADFLPILELGSDFCEKAGECGHRPLVVMAGALDGDAVVSKLFSYEGPFGVGYGVGSFLVTGRSEERCFLDRYLENERARAEARRRRESPQVSLARRTVECYVRTGRLYEAPEPLPPELRESRAGVFVSIKKQGALRGCIGTIAPAAENVGEEIRGNAVSAAARDPRFDAITPEELPYLSYSVDVLQPAEEIRGESALDPKRYGVIVTLGGKRGLLLPDLEGVDTADEQLRIAMQKADIAERDRGRVKLERFEAVRYT
ncbi:MAG: AmmeMemoRadiSam system protein A [Clostridiales Family XIII bacterium]|jgi:AmmeMemoRadiSam system protein A|nr:AmmeMemoRadiSam system protein A [Clostridiales Family XIII bacterium]